MWRRGGAAANAFVCGVLPKPALARAPPTWEDRVGLFKTYLPGARGREMPLPVEAARKRPLRSPPGAGLEGERALSPRAFLRSLDRWTLLAGWRLAGGVSQGAPGSTRIKGEPGGSRGRGASPLPWVKCPANSEDAKDK